MPKEMMAVEMTVMMAMPVVHSACPVSAITTKMAMPTSQKMKCAKICVIT